MYMKNKAMCYCIFTLLQQCVLLRPRNVQEKLLRKTKQNICVFCCCVFLVFVFSVLLCRMQSGRNNSIAFPPDNDALSVCLSVCLSLSLPLSLSLLPPPPPPFFFFFFSFFLLLSFFFCWGMEVSYQCIKVALTSHALTELRTVLARGT